MVLHHHPPTLHHDFSYSPLNKFGFVNIPLGCKCNTIGLIWRSESKGNSTSLARYSVHMASDKIKLSGNCITRLTHNEFRPNLNHSFLLRIMGNCCRCQQLSPPDITFYICLLSVSLYPLECKLHEGRDFVLFWIPSTYYKPRSTADIHKHMLNSWMTVKPCLNYPVLVQCIYNSHLVY